jgi:hypothetical protein
MATYQKDINYQAGRAALFIASPSGVGQVPYDVELNMANTHSTDGQQCYCGGLYIGGAGNLIVVMAQDTTNTLVTFNGVVAGTFLPIQVKKVSSTSTATNIMGLW